MVGENEVGVNLDSFLHNSLGEVVGEKHLSDRCLGSDGVNDARDRVMIDKAEHGASED